ncbi:MAG: hypothetical protein M3426_10150 [Actinomycetota bacterium]|jgi:hypothetical protein|nr:hypothetical protein [Actinomycetota bacterium]
MSSRASRLAWVVCAFTLSVLALVLVVILLGWSTALPQGRTPWRDQAVSLVGIVGAPILGGLIASRRPRNPYGWVWLVFGSGLALQLLAESYAAYALVVDPGSLPAPRTISRVLGLGGPLALAFAPFLLLLFPTGYLPSSRWRPLAWAAATAGAALLTLNLFFASPDKVGGTVTAMTVAAASAIFVVLVLSALSLVVRYRRTGGVERQQLKWFALAAVVAASSLVGQLLGEALWNLLIAATNTALYVAVGVAILRHRLYDIDLIINRALVYGSLTAMLALVYVGGVVGLQAAFRTISGQESTLAVVASTLAIAALFVPLRRRVQGFVDRRFYRRKYDATKTLEAFGSRLREETDLEALIGDLVGIASRTVQPAHVSLWLRPDAEPEARSAPLEQSGHDK